ncbi:DUF4156 domain-containing protein [Pseudoxanthomonas daejeonensis]|uniref:DUF4156 domain-containing protein n=1 Tax=Pseudoxanthomonas daejeonensis TaxID=266062 RepID=A0ABQ6ZBP6_9GAMM|nr:DUF4156 domain-containing protein [Pseudoxanthomonas daejeonensis]KAF1697459.1 hypothetical protein CSC65_00900 [Pseudoxanthomonas daejeonensis]UNK58612.1 DUF4156 domain-containing protein [Pseudoxanthomonas daejeonensis]
MLRPLSVLLLVLPLAACTWVSLKPEAKQVRVVPAGAAPAGCTKQGEIEVSVKNSVAFYERNTVKVRDELETLARNEALGLPADTLQPLGEPADGTQRFAAWRCAR